MQKTGSLLTVDETADLLRVKRSTLYTWVHRRQVPFQKVGSLLRFRKDDLAAWLEGQRRPVEEVNHI
jgi:excisionase family DNA binding protein